MAPTIEASSLFDTVKLADDPPLNPSDVNFQTIRTPLVLYIARVPGTNDIFLTTMKPLQKVVTASDVESCLYYVHLDSIEDEKLLGSTERDHIIDHTADGSDALLNALGGATGSLKRKPLPPAHASASGKTSGTSPGSRPSPQFPIRGLNQPSLRPATTTAYSDTAMNPTTTSTGALHGPRPMQPRFQMTPGPASPQNQSRTFDDNPWRTFEQPNLMPPKLPPRPDGSDGTTMHSTSGGYNNISDEVDQNSSPRVMRFRRDKSNGFTKAEPKQDFNKDKSLTLIRRYGGLQSNVGKIVHSTGRRGSSPGLEPLAGSPSPSSETLIEISTPGYRKFINSGVEMSSTPRHSQELRSPHQPSLGDGDAATADSSDSITVFRRQLHILSSRKRPSIQDRPGSSASSQGYFKSASSLEVPHYAQQANGPPSPLQQGSTQWGARGHTVQSPWNGICEFRTGIAGRSLKCTHASPNSVHSAAVSELRFNLPSSSALGPPRTQSSSDTSQRWKRSSIFHNRAHSSSEVPTSSPPGSKVGLEDRMDMSLGQERAGGGFGGKQAKLGKMIIEEEGLKMLDLTVAANVALWWRVFESSL